MTLLSRRDFSALQDRLNRVFREAYSPEGSEETLTTGNFVAATASSIRLFSILATIPCPCQLWNQGGGSSPRPCSVKWISQFAPSRT